VLSTETTPWPRAEVLFCRVPDRNSRIGLSIVLVVVVMLVVVVVEVINSRSETVLVVSSKYQEFVSTIAKAASTRQLVLRWRDRV
jgi:hypothetical protein